MKNIILICLLSLTSCSTINALNSNSKFDLLKAKQECVEADEAFPLVIHDIKFMVLKFDDCLDMSLLTVGWWGENDEFSRTLGKFLLLQFIRERDEAFEEKYEYKYLGIRYVAESKAYIMIFELIEVEEE